MIIWGGGMPAQLLSMHFNDTFAQTPWLCPRQCSPHTCLATLQCECRQDDEQLQLAWVSHTSLPVKQQRAQLVSSLAGMFEGRRYLSTAIRAVVQQLCEWLQPNGSETQHEVRPAMHLV